MPDEGMLETGPTSEDPELPDGVGQHAAELGQPPDEEADRDFGAEGLAATGDTPGMESPSKSAGGHAGHSQATTPGRVGAEQDLSARWVPNHQSTPAHSWNLMHDIQANLAYCIPCMF